jgi:hypothetical protein
MASRPHTVKFPPDLFEVMALRAKALGYRTAADYVRSLVRYDALVQGGHDVTLPISHLPDADQDRIDAQLLELTKRGTGKRGQLLSKLIERVAAAGKHPSGEAIAKSL